MSMKLADVKEQIDNFFDNVSSEEFEEILNKYNMLIEKDDGDNDDNIKID